MRLTTAALIAAAGLTGLAFMAGTTDTAEAARKGKARAAGACRALTFHPEARIGGSCCFVDGHTHSGSGSGSSRAAATNDAIKSWSDFVVFEYGGAYRSWGRSISKSVSCSGGGGGWSCSVESTPCH